MSLAENIQRLRKLKQLSQPQLADKAKLSKGYVYMLESGEMTNPSIEKLSQIADALECTIADLIGQPKTQARIQASPEIPEALQEFARRKRKQGDPLSEADLMSLAHTQYRGNRPKTPDDWAYVYEFLKRTLEDRS